MKYMTFNQSCSFAGVANMLEDFSENIEDYQLAIAMKVPYIFRFDEISKCYHSGAMLQDKKYFNYHLQKLNLKLIENKVSKNEIVAFIRSSQSKLMLGLNLSNGMKHAVIYTGMDDDKFVFLNNARKDSDEPIFYKYSADEILSKTDEFTMVSYILKSQSVEAINLKEEMEKSIEYIDRFKEEIALFCDVEHSISSLRTTMNTHFRSIFLDVHSMMEILNNNEILNEISEIRTAYLKAMKLNMALRLSSNIDIDALLNVITAYQALIRQELTNLM